MSPNPAPIHGFDDDNEERRERTAPTMSRSWGQLATAYAPGAFFTFEGGLGACLAQSDGQAGLQEANISPTVRHQIVMRFEDAVKSWFDAAMHCRPNDGQKPPVRAAQCVSQSLINSNYDGLRPVDGSRYVFLSPERMGYVPAPLTFVCNHCGLYRYFGSVRDFAARKDTALNVKCSHSAGNCHWRQLDVIFVHWSGNWEPVRPGKWYWDNNAKEVQEPFDRCRQCGGNEFRLETRHSESAIGRWYFVCANPACKHEDHDGWVKNDHDTLDIVREDFIRLPAVAHMEPVSYRASAAYYPQADQFILFADQQEGLLALLDPSRQNDLKGFIAQRFGFGRARPPMSEVETILKQSEKGAASLARFKLKAEMLGKLPQPLTGLYVEMSDSLKDDMREIENSWYSDGLVRETNSLPVALINGIDERKNDFDARYDPYRLVVEHEALKQNHLEAPREATGRSPFVHFDRLDKDLAPKDETEQAQQEAATRLMFDRLGLDTMGLIRNFKLCKFTYGFTRVSAAPIVEKHRIRMPVRLNLFPPVKMEQGASRTPIYVITQENEAFYVRLNPAMVYQWLGSLNLADMFTWHPAGEVPLGALLLERAPPMQRFLANVHREQAPLAYYYTYTLLHTYSHVMMRAIAELSGLDASSLGEYLFPADLSFVIYRSGTTLDLGNLSSLWRNDNANFLRHIGEPTTLACNSGSLCAERGGACPDCILIPEQSCIAQNQLLSRSVLRGGPRPREDVGTDRIPGYLDIVHAALAP